LETVQRLLPELQREQEALASLRAQVQALTQAQETSQEEAAAKQEELDALHERRRVLEELLRHRGDEVRRERTRREQAETRMRAEHQTRLAAEAERDKEIEKRREAEARLLEQEEAAAAYLEQVEDDMQGRITGLEGKLSQSEEIGEQATRRAARWRRRFKVAARQRDEARQNLQLEKDYSRSLVDERDARRQQE
jgi:hypothetical protein